MFIGSLHRFFCESIGGLFAFDLTGRKTSARKLRNLEKHVEEDILHFFCGKRGFFSFTLNHGMETECLKKKINTKIFMPVFPTFTELLFVVS